MRLAAFDISSKLGWAAWDGAAQNPTIDTKTLAGFQYSADSMLELYRKWLDAWIEAYRPELVGIEGWLINPDAVTSAKLIQLSGFTQWRLSKKGVRSTLVPAGTWRRAVYGSGKGNTEEWKRKALARADFYGWRTKDGYKPDHNAAEAGLIVEYLARAIAQVTPPWKLVGHNSGGDLLV